MREVRVLLTCIGGRFSRNMIRALKESKDPKITLVGVDADSDIAAKKEVDSFYKVPLGSDEGYSSELLTICRKENIAIVIPCSDEEAEALSRHKEAFAREKIICAVDDWKIVSLTNDKWNLFEYLAGCGLAQPKYRLIENAKDLKESADFFEYPKNKLVLQPNQGRGARGVSVIGEDTGSTPLAQMMPRYEGGARSILMEYLPGPAYDVDVLAEGGKPVCIVPRRREWENELSPYSEGCVVEENTQLMEFVRDITEKLKLNYVYDFDCGTTSDGRPAIYEINPRFSGAIAASAAAGANIPVMLVRMLLGMDLPKCNIRFGTRMRPGPDGEMKFSYEEKYADKGKT